jgi:hypothetical protein
MLASDDHPLATEEIRLYNHLADAWSLPGITMSSVKAETLSDELRSRLVGLGEVFGLTVTFPLLDDPLDASKPPAQTVYAVRSKAVAP